MSRYVTLRQNRQLLHVVCNRALGAANSFVWRAERDIILSTYASQDIYDRLVWSLLGSPVPKLMSLDLTGATNAKLYHRRVSADRVGKLYRDRVR